MPETLQRIPIAKPLLDEREVEAVRRVILSGWVTQGPEVEAFERDFARQVGASHACAVSNCTTALHLALLAVGVGAGDEVITVSHSFIATANAVKYCGATPVFIDIEPDTYNMDPALIEAAITPKTKAILCVHQLGMPCDLAAIVEIGRRREVPVIEDAACAIGSEILWNGRWEKIGKPHGDIACFSFHPRKVITTGDGNDTAGFVCRAARGQTRFSAHAYGLAVDVNPFQNPLVKGDLVLPELASAYRDREWWRPGMFLPGSAAVRAFTREGWTWGGTFHRPKDYQHFSRTGD